MPLHALGDIQAESAVIKWYCLPHYGKCYWVMHLTKILMFVVVPHPLWTSHDHLKLTAMDDLQWFCRERGNKFL